MTVGVGWACAGEEWGRVGGLARGWGGRIVSNGGGGGVVVGSASAWEGEVSLCYLGPTSPLYFLCC